MNKQQLNKSGQGRDAGIVEQIESQIYRQLGGRVNDLRVIVQGEGLVLQGRARTYHAKQLAQQAAMEITERSILANEIRVSSGSRPARLGFAAEFRAQSLLPGSEPSSRIEISVCFVAILRSAARCAPVAPCARVDHDEELHL